MNAMRRLAIFFRRSLFSTLLVAGGLSGKNFLITSAQP